MVVVVVCVCVCVCVCVLQCSYTSLQFPIRSACKESRYKAAESLSAPRLLCVLRPQRARLLPTGRGENLRRWCGAGRQCRAQRRAAELKHLHRLHTLLRSAGHMPDRRRSGIRAAGTRLRGRGTRTALEGRRRIMTRRGSAARVRRAREGAAGPRHTLLAAAAARWSLGLCCTGAAEAVRPLLKPLILFSPTFYHFSPTPPQLFSKPPVNFFQTLNPKP